MNKLKTFVAACGAAIFVSAAGNAETQTSASVSAAVVGVDEDVDASLSPNLSFQYQGPQSLISSELSTSFRTDTEDAWSGIWQSANSYAWRSKTQRLFFGLNYSHQESEFENDKPGIVLDSASSQLGVRYAQTKTLQHQLVMSGNYTLVDNNQIEQNTEDHSITGGYSVNWLSSEAQSWQLQSSYTKTRADAEILVGGLNWRIEGVSNAVFAGVNVNETSQNESINTVLGGNVGFQHTGEDITSLLLVRREQTDALTYFNAQILDRVVELDQQEEIVLNEASLTLSGWQLTKQLGLSLTALVGETQSVRKIDDVDFESKANKEYHQGNVTLNYLPNAKSTLTAILSIYEDQDRVQHVVSVNYGHQINQSWNWGLNARQEVQETSPVSWALSMNYSF